MLPTDVAIRRPPTHVARPSVAGPAPLATVAHDLRQPTAAALLTGELVDELLDARAPAEVLRQQAALVRRSMQHALRLTADLLRVSFTLPTCDAGGGVRGQPAGRCTWALC